MTDSTEAKCVGHWGMGGRPIRGCPACDPKGRCSGCSFLLTVRGRPVHDKSLTSYLRLLEENTRDRRDLADELESAEEERDELVKKARKLGATKTQIEKAVGR